MCLCCWKRLSYQIDQTEIMNKNSSIISTCLYLKYKYQFCHSFLNVVFSRMMNTTRIKKGRSDQSIATSLPDRLVDEFFNNANEKNIRAYSSGRFRIWMWNNQLYEAPVILWSENKHVKSVFLVC